MNIDNNSREEIDHVVSLEEYQFYEAQHFVEMFFKKLTKYEPGEVELKGLDKKLSLFIIDSFSTLFDLWNTHPSVKRTLETELFYNVFSHMFETFNFSSGRKSEEAASKNSPSEIKVCCDVCDEEFVVENNDLETAYATHSIVSSEHITMMKIFEKMRIIENKDCNEGVGKTDMSRIVKLSPDFHMVDISDRNKTSHGLPWFNEMAAFTLANVLQEDEPKLSLPQNKVSPRKHPNRRKQNRSKIEKTKDVGMLAHFDQARGDASTECEFITESVPGFQKAADIDFAVNVNVKLDRLLSLVYEAGIPEDKRSKIDEELLGIYQCVAQKVRKQK